MSSPSALPVRGAADVDGGDEIRGDGLGDADAGGGGDAVVLQRIREHPRKPGRFRLTASGGHEWTVDADSLSKLGLPSVGAELRPAAMAQLDRAANAVAAFDRAVGMLARARRTRRELTLRLRQRSVDEESIRIALGRLEALHLLDDAAVARAEAAARFRRGEGERRIRQALGAKGVAREHVDSAIREVLESEAVNPEALCMATAEKRLRALKSLAPEVQRRRLLGFLVRRGYEYALVSQVVNALLGRAEYGAE